MRGGWLRGENRNFCRKGLELLMLKSGQRKDGGLWLGTHLNFRGI